VLRPPGHFDTNSEGFVGGSDFSLPPSRQRSTINACHWSPHTARRYVICYPGGRWAGQSTKGSETGGSSHRKMGCSPSRLLKLLRITRSPSGWSLDSALTSGTLVARYLFFCLACPLSERYHRYVTVPLLDLSRRMAAIRPRSARDHRTELSNKGRTQGKAQFPSAP
jgi:hypothetical protein